MAKDFDFWTYTENDLNKTLYDGPLSLKDNGIEKVLVTLNLD